MKFKIGDIIKNIKTQAIYVVVPDKGSKNPTTQIRLNEIKEELYELYKVKTSFKFSEPENK